MTPSPTTKPPANSSEPAATGRSRWPNRFLLPILVILIATTIALGETTRLDFWIQDFFFDPSTARWLVDATNPLLRAIFYNGPKIAIILLGVALLILLTGPDRWRQRFGTSRTKLAAALAIMAAVPISIGVLKARSDVYCPSQLTRYGGAMDYRAPFMARPDGSPTSRGRCWPAGHASGGFGLLGLVFLARSRKQIQLAVALALAIGWLMGAYQMLKGAHFMSHTIVTMLLALLLTVALARTLPSLQEESLR